MSINFRAGDPIITLGTFVDQYRAGEPYAHVQAQAVAPTNPTRILGDDMVWYDAADTLIKIQDTNLTWVPLFDGHVWVQGDDGWRQIPAVEQAKEQP